MERNIFQGKFENTESVSFLPFQMLRKQTLSNIHVAFNQLFILKSVSLKTVLAFFFLNEMYHLGTEGYIL